MIRRLICRFIGCFRCQVYDVPEGIGGQCIDCGKIHGWVTRDELRAYADRVLLPEYPNASRSRSQGEG